MGRRKNNDVFVIGEEALAETTALRDTDRLEPAGDPEPEAAPAFGGARPSPPGPARSPRLLAALGISAAAAATLTALELSSAGDRSDAQRPKTSAPSALVMGPAPGAAESPLSAIPPSSHRRKPVARTQSGRTGGDEPEREPTEEEAPASSPPPPVATYPQSAPAPEPPSPPPSPGGGGQGGTEPFGFER